MIITSRKFSKSNHSTADSTCSTSSHRNLSHHRTLAFLLISLIASGCSFSEVSTGDSTSKSAEPVILVDQTGKEWDITSAVNKYGFEMGRFEYGLGPFAIEPIVEPEVLNPNDAGYPESEGTFLVIGTSINGDTRAYGRLDIVQSEIVDDYIGGVPLAVAY